MYFVFKIIYFVFRKKLKGIWRAIFLRILAVKNAEIRGGLCVLRWRDSRKYNKRLTRDL